MNSKIEKLVWAWRDSKRIKKVAHDLMTRNSDHFRSGVWKIRWGRSKAFLIRKSGEATEFYHAFCRKNYSSTKARIRDRLMDLLCAGWKYRQPDNPSPVFAADCVIISVSGDLLFFDLQKMILKGNNEKGNRGYYRLKEAGYWEHFLTPVLGIEDGVSYEKVILSHKQPAEKENEEKQFQNILRKYRDYFDDTQPAECRTVAELAVPYRSWAPEFDRIFPPSILQLQLSCYMQHGDIKQDNLIWDRFGNMYVIDYEMASVQPFFQDLLYFASYRAGLGCEDWHLLDRLMDPSTKTGRLFDDLLARQGIPANTSVKLAFLVLSRLVLPSLFEGVFSSERDVYSFYRLREQGNINRMIAHFMGGNAAWYDSCGEQEKPERISL